jgi:acyl-coenzyme A synthetase/AMP-(fatty) acid ligase
MFELTFDVSVSSYLPALLKGACVYTVPNDGIKYMHVLRVMTQYRLTSVQMVPSVIKLAKKLLNRISIPEVKRCILTGEATMVDLLELWLPCVPNASIFNFYGPTESTIYCSFLQYAEARPKSYNGMLAIGKSLKGMDLLIVNDLGDEASPNEKGELLIGGPQVTAGYLKNESKNKESFVSRSINGEPKSFYRSGDMCYRDEDGEIFYCGRFDNQVKIQGFRIELSEIEFLVRKQFGVNNVVIVEENEQGVTKLLLVIESQLNEDITKIIAYLKDKLPDYMVPGVTNSMEEFPLNSSGKTDRKKIKEILSGSLTA